MNNFRELYCAQHECTPEQFSRRVFSKCLYPHARVVAPIIQLFSFEYFSADRALVASAGEATSMKKIREDVREFFWDSTNSGWMRRRINIRISGQRLRNLARRYLPEGDTPIPFPRIAKDVSTIESPKSADYRSAPQS